jgi:hypothetical protein
LKDIFLKYLETHFPEILNFTLNQTNFDYFRIKKSNSNISQFISDPNQTLYNTVHQNLENQIQNIIF